MSSELVGRVYRSNLSDWHFIYSFASVNAERELINIPENVLLVVVKVTKDHIYFLYDEKLIRAGKGYEAVLELVL